MTTLDVTPLGYKIGEESKTVHELIRLRSKEGIKFWSLDSKSKGLEAVQSIFALTNIFKPISYKLQIIESLQKNINDIKQKQIMFQKHYEPIVKKMDSLEVDTLEILSKDFNANIKKLQLKRDRLNSSEMQLESRIITIEDIYKEYFRLVEESKNFYINEKKDNGVKLKNLVSDKNIISILIEYEKEAKKLKISDFDNLFNYSTPGIDQYFFKVKQSELKQFESQIKQLEKLDKMCKDQQIKLIEKKKTNVYEEEKEIEMEMRMMQEEIKETETEKVVESKLLNETRLRETEMREKMEKILKELQDNQKQIDKKIIGMEKGLAKTDDSKEISEIKLNDSSFIMKGYRKIKGWCSVREDTVGNVSFDENAINSKKSLVTILNELDEKEKTTSSKYVTDSVLE